MLQNYLKIAFRNLIKNKSHTLINVGGLTLGIVCALVIYLVIQFDTSFDTWHENSDRIYRVVTVSNDYGSMDYNPGGAYPRADAIRNDVTGIEAVTLIHNNFGTPIISLPEETGNDRKFKEDNLVLVDSDFFKIFSYQWITGTPDAALNRPNTAVVSTSFAQKLFGTADVLGREFVVFTDDYIDVEITGIVADPPNNTDFPFVAFVERASRSRSGLSYPDENTGWSNTASGIQNFVKLKPGVTAEQINAQFDPMIVKYRNEETAADTDYLLQPLSEIHFDGRYGNYSGRIVAKETLLSLAVIGILLLITACINFINLNTAIAVRRSKEVGLRKTLGGTKTQLTLHFLGETAFIVLIAVTLSLGITELLIQRLEPLLGFTPELNLFTNYSIDLFLFGLIATITLAAGWYPATYLSGFSPIEAIRNKINASYGQGLTLRRGLIVVQFAITQVLIISTIIIANQIKFFETSDMGYDKEALIEIPIPQDDKQIIETFKNRLQNESSIVHLTFSNTGTTSNSTWAGNYLVMEDTVRHEDNAHIKFVDADFVKTYGLTILAGHDLTPSDTVNQYLVNETFAKKVGYGDNYQGLVGKDARFWGMEAPIAGVVKDFNTQSLHSELPPVIVATRRNFSLAAARVQTGRIDDALKAMESAFEDAYPDFVFEYRFLDESIREMYQDEQRTANIMNAFTIVAILIGSLGLFGLVSYMAATRTKEIGVRKVLGASLVDILSIFSNELGLLLGIAFAIAAPLAWYMMQRWLSDFPYRIDIGVGIFALALGGTIVLAMITVGYKAISAAIANPVESLKTE